MKKLVLLCALAALLTGCYSLQKNLDSWMGSTGAQFIERGGMGPPDDVRSDGRDGRILVWGKQPGAVTQIYVHKDDNIYFWRHYSAYDTIIWFDE